MVVKWYSGGGVVVTTVAVVARTIGASGMFKVYGRLCTMIIMIVTFFVLIRKKNRYFVYF